MSDTYETVDGSKIIAANDIAKYAEQLKRERDQWRECAEERKKAWYEMQSAFERSRDEVNALERERDRWRKCAEWLADAVRFWIGAEKEFVDTGAALAEFERLKEGGK